MCSFCVTNSQPPPPPNRQKPALVCCPVLKTVHLRRQKRVRSVIQSHKQQSIQEDTNIGTRQQICLSSRLQPKKPLPRWLQDTRWEKNICKDLNTSSRGCGWRTEEGFRCFWVRRTAFFQRREEERTEQKPDQKDKRAAPIAILFMAESKQKSKQRAATVLLSERGRL